MSATEQNTLQDQILVVFADKSDFDQALRSVGVEKVERNEQGKPYIPDSPYFISFSHKGEVSVAAISDHEVGVDIENVTAPRNITRLSRLFDDSEVPESLYDFYRLWTAKEAMGKYNGTGINLAVLKQKTVDVRHLDYGDYIIGVVGKGDISLKVF
ncbi:MAG TPA: hypothetical protein DCG79_05255 [Clostridiales bacterium]|nr:hypothetical protein [Clostridiales bacterium]